MYSRKCVSDRAYSKSSCGKGLYRVSVSATVTLVLDIRGLRPDYVEQDKSMGVQENDKKA
jgi:hypothetical protein